MIRRYLTLLALLAALRLLARLARVALTVAVLAAAAPVTVAALAGLAVAWLRGWPPGRLYRSALWCLPMAAVWLAATAAAARSWQGAAGALPAAWLAMWAQPTAGPAALAAVSRAVLTMAPVAVPLGLLAAGLGWSRRIAAMRAGAAGRSPGAAVAFDRRQWRHQVRSARARIAAPGAVPLVPASGSVVAGAVIRAVGHPARPLAAIPYQRLRSHQVLIGTTGTGKTTLLLRLWAGFLARGRQLHAAGAGRRPLLVVLDCKGGADSRRVADRARRVLREAGARATACWPDDAALSLWDLPPQQLTTTLTDLIEHGSGAAAFYADVLEAVVAMAVGAPGGPPRSGAEFLARLDAGWLAAAYAGSGADADLLRAAARHITDIALRFRTLLRRLGGGLDGPGSFADADVWYCILEGTDQVSVAETQARALVDLLAGYAARGDGRDRDILLAVDEFSAVSRRLPIWQLYERARSLGLAVQVSAQSWQGLAATEDERYRIAATADGGVWLLRSPYPEPVTALAGTQPAVQSSRRLLGAALWSRQGSSRLQPVPVADPALIRALDVGQAAYLYRGGVTYVQVKRMVAGPAALAPGEPATPAPMAAADAADAVAAATPAQAASAVAAGAVAAGAVAAGTVAAGAVAPPASTLTGPAPPGTNPPGAGAGQAAGPLPDVGPFLDEVFGPGPS